MKHTLEKSIILIILVILMFIGLSNQTYAMDNTIAAGDSFIQIGEKENNNNSAIDAEALRKTSNNIYNILFTIGIVIAVAVGLIIGIQFMIASIDEKAKIKETLVPYVIGVFIIFAAFGIWKIAVQIGNSLNYTTTEEEAQNSSKSLSEIKLKLRSEYLLIVDDLSTHGYVYDKSLDVWRGEDNHDDEDAISNKSIIEQVKNTLTQQERILLMDAGYWNSIKISEDGVVSFE